jgi:hypothetical protein
MNKGIEFLQRNIIQKEGTVAKVDVSIVHMDTTKIQIHSINFSCLVFV